MLTYQSVIDSNLKNIAYTKKKFLYRDKISEPAAVPLDVLRKRYTIHAPRDFGPKIAQTRDLTSGYLSQGGRGRKECRALEHMGRIPVPAA